MAPTLVFTGQHPGLEASDHGLDPFPCFHLGCPGQDDPHAHVGMVSKALFPIMARAAPSLVIVQGDTSSALGGALAAKLAQVPIAHVEAGLRSHNRRHPWPEEEFRIAIDRDSDLLFAPTELSAANLRRDRAGGRIFVTGNSGIDALEKKRAALRDPCAGDLPRLLVTCHRRENWAVGIDSIAAALKTLAIEGVIAIHMVLHPNPTLSRRVRELLDGIDNISFREPCGHSELLDSMVGADLVLSDSGGMQEEATALGVPLLVLRERTERPEAIACGTVEIVGTGPDRIVAAVRRRLKTRGAPAPARPFGDGRASERISAIIEQWLRERDEVRLPPISSTCPRQLGNW